MIARPAVLALALLCIWDTTTLDDEIRGLPDDYPLVVTGRWHRHGDAYYERRVHLLEPGLEAGFADLADYDDLAVAYERLDRIDDAVRVMALKAEALAERPDDEHRYRYHANLGTFHAHAGRFDEALVQLDSAVTLNPEAHFGRERFQIALICYLRAARADSTAWETHDFLTWGGYDVMGYTSGHGRYGYDLDEPVPCWATSTAVRDDRRETWEEMHTAVVGMLRFGGIEGPELYRALGDLYSANPMSQPRPQKKHYAWWAYRRALVAGHPARTRIEVAVQRLEGNERAVDLASEETFHAVRENGELWLANYRAAEAEAIARGEDPDADHVMQALYAEADRRTPPVPRHRAHWLVSRFYGVPKEQRWGIGLVGVLVGILCLNQYRWLQKRRS